MSQIKELGILKIKAKDKLLFEHEAHNIPPLGVRVGYVNERKEEISKDKVKNIILVGKIIDIIGPVKNPVVVVKTEKNNVQDSYPKDLIFYYLKEKKKKNYKKKSFKDKKNR